MSDLLGVGGRAWLAERVERLPLDERLTVEPCLRQIGFVDDEPARLDKPVAADAVSDDDALRLMTSRGVSAITAIALLAAVGDVTRFKTPRHLVGYLGLDPRVRQSGSEPAKHGRISKQGRPGSGGGSVSWFLRSWLDGDRLELRRVERLELGWREVAEGCVGGGCG